MRTSNLLLASALTLMASTTTVLANDANPWATQVPPGITVDHGAYTKAASGQAAKTPAPDAWTTQIPGYSAFANNDGYGQRSELPERVRIAQATESFLQVPGTVQ